ncbi:hypothetical protein SPI_04097 [Niveomyces insectorum RCEF 264]|uniref:Tyrosine specific protein phosphatases domain-containing protein n=1 Tax=Niveomyces insectorum RCEF 264 TaxID=1081102 RepID=A0A167VFH4_9HYPO|nr:hypothetical protein SPI_04097 [Niveomyces insectorum RCEF 264]
MAASPLPAAQLRALSETDVTVRLTPEQFLPVLTQPPFVTIEGTFNVRDLGRIPGGSAATGAAEGQHTVDARPSPLRPGFAFRGGMLTFLTPAGKATIVDDLGVRAVFDLRSRSEHSRAPDPPLGDGDRAVNLVWSAETAERDPNVDLAPFVEGYGEAGFVATYLEVLQAYGPTIQAVLAHVRDRPTQPFLFHCTAGRDRTGVLAGLLLTLAGASPDVIALDYLLSRVGSEPVRDKLEQFARQGAGVMAGRKVPTAAAGAADGAAAETTEPPPPPGFLNLINLRVQCWDAFVAALEKEHGGFEGYVTNTLGFSAADLATIKTNLTTAP